MANIMDWILIVISSTLFFKSLNRILSYKSNTIADYVMIVIYIFNCLPVLLDHTIGVPKYTSWYFNFELALGNDLVRLVYSIYILISIFCLYIYIKRHNVKETNIYSRNNSIIFNNKVLPLVILLPYMHILITGNLTKYFIYGTYNTRGLTSSFYQLNTVLVFISMFAFCCLFFCKKVKRGDYLILFLYAFSIMWIDGKRYIVVTILVMFLFFLLNSIRVKYKRIPIKGVFIFVVLALLIFNSIYSLYIKPVATSSFDSMYMSYRIDFGRDDVTKFVLYRELIVDEPILDYRGETFISTIFMLVPRTIWPSKPYPHYRYLTSELYGTSSELDIPGGMTPSLYEMSVANFGVFLGIVVTVFILIFACRWADRSKSVPRKALYLLLIVGLLTQSMDALMAYIILAPLSAFSSWAKRSVNS
ncbi:hypothetical protein NKR74_22785 [Bacillus sp. 3103sda1]|uniref:hypothetical protein n=1 Tax=Bacillus sp. 3103sda1 TaxID=2953808 RepID=UPI00209FF51F|nr:hypothetical protein [Bacillus sp. 3103sda1]MCP1126093.1 hypothetical protein [Bacillus sp. 3103sda1]